MSRFAAQLVKRLPAAQRARLVRLRRPAWLFAFRGVRPLSDRYGYDRGMPIDRYYIESYLSEHRADIRGRGLEVKSATYLRRFGSDLERLDVLDVDPANANATVIDDLSSADDISDQQYDCFVLTQTLHMIYDIRSAVRHAHRILKPGGVLLATMPCVARIDRGGAAFDFWRVTGAACETMFGEAFGAGNCTVRSYGNVRAATAFLTGMAAEELGERQLCYNDPNFPVLLCVRGVRR